MSRNWFNRANFNFTSRAVVVASRRFDQSLSEICSPFMDDRLELCTILVQWNPRASPTSHAKNSRTGFVGHSARSSSPFQKLAKTVRPSQKSLMVSLRRGKSPAPSFTRSPRGEELDPSEINIAYTSPSSPLVIVPKCRTQPSAARTKAGTTTVQLRPRKCCSLLRLVAAIVGPG